MKRYNQLNYNNEKGSSLCKNVILLKKKEKNLNRQTETFDLVRMFVYIHTHMYKSTKGQIFEKDIPIGSIM